ncbi:unnamed protein product [Rotaria sordida]|uniref:Uncharacterized protein n=1 Tax=Rotaria sordida TaxID=392033 RepID=A0A814M4H1_9BILA|nr:unnamed protein product [Rotaria sordida]CAF3747851.1 unnamed protein product [Rotaria sordida]
MSSTNRENIINRSSRGGTERNEIRNNNPYGNLSPKPQQSDDSTLIRRTLVERGLRPVGDGNIANTSSSTSAAITAIAKQREDEQRELQDLNAKFAVYLDRVQYLEDYNQRLSADLHDLKQEWGGDMSQLQVTYGPQLQALRIELDKTIRDQALQELQLKRYDYDIWHIQEQIASLDSGFDSHKLNILKQELEASYIGFEQLKNLYDKTFNDLENLKNLMDGLVKEVDGLKNELDNEQLERLMIENELQTLNEDLAFQNAVYKEQREELLSLNTPTLDLSAFYRAELAHAISDIRRDFEVLSQSQTNELEAYYKIKTEQVREEIETENERKRLLANESTIDVMDTAHLTSSLREGQNELISLQKENRDLQIQFDAIIDDLEKIQNERLREKESIDRELALIREQTADKKDLIDAILENNVSLRFELSTYRGLLQAEEQHLNRMEQEPQTHSLSSPGLSSGLQLGLPSGLSSGLPLGLPSGLSSSKQNQEIPNRDRSNSGTKKMTVQKTARGPISFESVDLETDSVILVNEKYSGNEQSFLNWSIRRQIDQKPEIVYQFPSTFSLRPRQTIRIFSKHSESSANSLSDNLVADKINTWGIGQHMITRLIDNNNEEKAIITQIFQ